MRLNILYSLIPQVLKRQKNKNEKNVTHFFMRSIERINLDFDGDDVNLGYYLEPQGFEKIRRITGYLVGTVDRFNDAKRAEERDRVKHM